MKKLIVVLMMIFTIGFTFATTPVAYKATVVAPKTMVLSGGTSNTFTTLHADFTYGLKKSNLHAKINLQFNNIYLEGLMQYNVGEFQNIDLGFTWGGRIRINSTTVELAPVLLWNMSYQLASNVAFYGGAQFNFDMGISTWTGFYIDFDLNGYLGTQIDLIDNLKLYVEVQPAIWSGTNTAYLGVNYYFPTKSNSVEMPDA